MKNKQIIPKRIQLEVVFGCNANCIMCPVNHPSKRKKGVMSLELFKYIVDEIHPHRSEIEKFDLWGLGEPLLDKTLFKKIEYAKKKGYRNLAIATNAGLLNNDAQDQLLMSGLDTVIFSIDGVKKHTHEHIRQGTDFDSVVKNVKSIIKKRDLGNYKTRFVLRFIRQEANINEFFDFKQYWENLISKNKKDLIIGYNVHSWGGEISVTENSKCNNKDAEFLERVPCHHIFDRLIFFWDGTVPLCCSDLHHGDYSIGKVVTESPIEIFNNDRINRIRKTHLAGKKNCMEICKNCTILNSEYAQDIFK